MSVLVPSFPSSSSSTTTNNSHNLYFTSRRLNGNNCSQIIKQNSKDNENDQVPFGVVNSMKQRLLDKFKNESLLINNRHSITKSSNENLLQIKHPISPLKQTTRLSRSQDNLLNNNNNNTEQFTSYLQPKQDLIIVEKTLSNDDKISTHRHSYSELHVDEVPKPGTVSTVKNMFERQIRLSRYDCDKASNPSIPTNSRVNQQQQQQNREIRSPNRSRSISPNDMALRQRRTVIIPSSNTSTVSGATSYPDLVISHTPPTSTQVEMNKISKEESINNIHKEENINQNRLSTNLSSDTSDYKPMDFKSRLALFNRTNIVERSNEHSQISSNLKKISNHSQSVSLSSSNFITKPIVHHHHQQIEKKDISTEQNSQIKSITFFGGTKTNENTKSSLSISEPISLINTDETSVDIVDIPDVIGGNIKLNKSSIFSGIKKEVRVQFHDNINTFEYPSFNLAMSEYPDNDSDSDDDDDEKKTSVDDVDDDELEQLARINAEFNSNEKSLEPKGSLHTFRPTYLDQYELGTQHGSTVSDIFSREKYFSLSENFSNHSILKQEMTNHIQWSSMSTTTDLLF